MKVHVKRFLCLVFMSSMAIGLVPELEAGHHKASEKRKPNFVFFLVDDMGWGDLGCYGNTFHETPHIDRLRESGIKFTHGYSACTVCSPSRAAIMTGCYPARINLTDWIAGHKKPYAKLAVPDWTMHMAHDRVTMPEALKEAGYNTEFVGKWHLMPLNNKAIFDKHYPEAHGFDINVGGREWGQPKGKGKYFHPFDMPGLEGKPGQYLTDALTDKAVEFIDQQNADKPFMLYFSYYVVHGPIMAKKEYVDKYSKKKAAAGEKLPHSPAYAGMMQSLDDSVGRIMDQLKAKGFDDNTVVIFTADNGGTSEYKSGGLRGAKALAYEGGTRVAFMMRWPGQIEPGSTCDVPVIGNDFYPTMLDMAGLALKPEQHADGKSLVPLVKGKAQDREAGKSKWSRDTLYWHYPHYHKTKPYGAIRHNDFKLIEFFEDGKLELYDLGTDMKESKNLAAAMPEKADELLKKLKSWRQVTEAQMMTPNPKYDPAKANSKGGKKKKPKKKK